MNITSSSEYENASEVLLTHTDNVYSNSSFRLLAIKSRKKKQSGEYGNWSYLSFRFEITNNDIQYGSNGQYRSIVLDRSEFTSWIYSIKQVFESSDCYQNNIVVKRRLKKNDFVIKFAISEKMNCNAILMCIVANKNTYSKIGINGLIFQQYILQLETMINDILNFDMTFNNSIILLKNSLIAENHNLLLEKQIDQNNQIIALLGNNLKTCVSHNEFENTSTTQTIDTSICSTVSNEINSIEQVFDELDNDKNNDKNNDDIDNNNQEFLNNIDEKLENTELEKLFPMRYKDIENPPLQENKTEPTILEKYCNINDKNISLFSEIFDEAQKSTSLQNTGISKYYENILNDRSIQLKGCCEEDLQSIHYLSQFQYFKILTTFKQDDTLDGFVDIPLYYKPTTKINWKYDEVKNIFDLIAIYAYMHKFSNLLKIGIPNAIENKIIFTKCFRLIFEPLYMSYLMSVDINSSLETTIYSHYNSLNNSDFFKDWNDIASDINVNIPKDNDIKECIHDLMKYATKLKDTPMKANHDFYYNKNIVVLEYKNKFIWEHIFDISRIEAFIGDKKIDFQIFEDLINHCKSTVDTNLLAFLKEKFLKTTDSPMSIIDKEIAEKTKIEEATSLERFVGNELPDDFQNKQEIMDYIKEVKDSDIDLTELPDVINIHMIPDNVLFALYLWKPSTDLRVKQYSKLIKFINNFWKSKIDIISEYMSMKEEKSDVEKIENDVDWGSFV